VESNEKNCSKRWNRVMKLKEYWQHFCVTVDKTKEGCVVATDIPGTLRNSRKLFYIAIAVKTVNWFKPITKYYLKDISGYNESGEVLSNHVTLIKYPKYRVGDAVVIDGSIVDTIINIYYYNNTARYVVGGMHNSFTYLESSLSAVTVANVK
jgi:hypothetical protein